MIVRSRLGGRLRVPLGGPVIPGGVGDPPPPASGSFITSTSFLGRGLLQANASGAGGSELSLGLPLYDFRADQNGLITTANGPVSSLTSRGGAPGSFSQAAAANQPVHDDAGNYVRFAAASTSDAANGDFLQLSSHIVDRYRGQGAALGVVYLLFRIPASVSWTTWLFRVGINSASFTHRDRHAYHVGLFTATPRIIGIRGNATSNTNATLTALPAVNEWCALAFVLNDSRVAGVRNGASDQISRLFVKTAAGGTFATMRSVASNVLDCTTTAWDATTEANLLRLRFNNSLTGYGYGNVDIHSAAFDGEPHIANADIENNLNRLLLRVA